MTLELENGLNRVWMNQGIPKLITTIEDRAGVAKALGLELADLVDTLPIQIVSAGNDFMLVPLDSLELLGKAKLNLQDLPTGLPQGHRAVFAFTFDAPESDIRSRMFGESMGVREDPATGSAHGPLGWYIAEHELIEALEGVTQFTSHQGVEMARASELYVRVDHKAEGYMVSVGGQAVKVAEGTLWL